jgi:ligand-binding sensor domain-containing protein
MVWLGTSEGLFQYTGSHLLVIPFPDTVPPQAVTALYEDQVGTMWAGTESGKIFQYNVVQGMTSWTVEEGHAKTRITGFAEDSDGQFWISTYGEGLYVYSTNRLYNINRDDGLLDDDVYVIAPDGKGRIWAGTDNGATVCTFREEKKQIRSVSTADGLPDQIVRAILPDQKGNMWFGTYEAGIAYYDVSREAITHVVSHPEMGHINCMAYFQNTELWIGTEGNGLWRFTPATGKFNKIRKIESLQNANVRDLIKDVEGHIWVVSATNTLHTAFRPFETLEIPIGNIQSIFVSAPDHIWVGTDDGFFEALEDSEGQWVHTKIPNAPLTSVACLGEDSYGNIWIGSLDFGLCVYNPKSRSFHPFKGVEEVHLNPIISLLIDGDTLWLATLGRGVMQATIKGDVTAGVPINFQILNAQDEGNHNFVFEVTYKDRNEAWLATDGAGLVYTRQNQIVELPSALGLAPRTIYSIAQDSRGHLWLNTPDDGLVEYDGKSFRPLSIDEGLRSLTISAIASSPKGEILIVHNKGIDVLLPERRHFMYFDDEIGLTSPTPVLNAICEDKSGHVWIGMNDKIVKYSALEETLSIHPRTRIEHVSVNQSPIDYHTQTRFPAHQNFFAFDYVGLWYTSPASVKYLYTLEGHDLDWKESTDHLAIYSNLKPGKYTFRVKASENKFFYDEPLAEYAFEIKKPFWQEFWFISLASACFILLIYSYIKNREKRLRHIELLNKEKIESQFRTLKAQINPHFLFNSFNTLITIIDENTSNPDVPIEYVQKLADFYRSILQYREEDAISIPEEIHLVKNYYYLLQRRYGDNMILEVDIDGLIGFVPPLTLQMLVENAVKHNVISKSRPLTIRIYGEENTYVIVENNVQKKLSEVPSTKFGLQSIINRYDMISDKKVIVQETSDTFRVSIPIIKTEM